MSVALVGIDIDGRASLKPVLMPIFYAFVKWSRLPNHPHELALGLSLASDCGKYKDQLL
jgi:hypothetical protein